MPRPPSSSEATPWSTTSAGAAPAVARTAAIACSAATTPAFMSTDPQPWTRPSATTPANGSCVQRRVAGGDDVEVAVEAQPRAGPAPGSVTRAPTSSLRAASSPGYPSAPRSAPRSCSVDRGGEPARLGERREPLDRAALAAR